MTSELEQITELNERVKIKLAPSKLHGVGIFALQDIKKGDKLYLDHMPVMYNIKYADFDKLNKDVAETLLSRWPHIINGSLFAFPDVRFSAYCNHSDKPNIDAKNDVALKDIKAGTELTEDYRLIENAEKIYTWL